MGPFTGLRGDERGNILPLIAVLLLLIFGFAAMVIDLGWLFVVRGELQNAADAGALAGVVELVNNGEDFAQTIAVTFATEDGQFRLNRTSPKADAVDVTVLGPETLQVLISRAEGTAAGPVPTIFARIWGKETAEVRAVAVATLDHRVVGVGPGILLPIGVRDTWLTPGASSKAQRTKARRTARRRSSDRPGSAPPPEPIPGAVGTSKHSWAAGECGSSRNAPT